MHGFSPNEFKLPAVVLDSDDYKSLSDRAKHEFSARLKYIVEITQKISDLYTQSSNIDDLRHSLDVIELDCMINLSINPEPRDNVSPWLLHKSWTFECSAASLASSIDAETHRALNDQIPDVTAMTSDFLKWTIKRGDLLRSQLKRLMNAQQYCSAIGALICIDALLATLILGLTKSRLNRNIRA